MLEEKATVRFDSHFPVQVLVSKGERFEIIMYRISHTSSITYSLLLSTTLVVLLTHDKHDSSCMNLLSLRVAVWRCWGCPKTWKWIFQSSGSIWQRCGLLQCTPITSPWLPSFRWSVRLDVGTSPPFVSSSEYTFCPLLNQFTPFGRKSIPPRSTGFFSVVLLCIQHV